VVTEVSWTTNFQCSKAGRAKVLRYQRVLMICGPFSPLGTSRSESPARQEEQV
jgi:hypothetical protein